MDARLAPPEQHEAATLQHDTPQVEVSHGVQIGQELQVPDPMVLLEESQQVVVQPPAAGELSHINALSALVGSLSSLVQSLSGMSIPAVASNISALPPASSITVPPVVLHNTQGIQNASFIPESLTPAAPVRAPVPEICMKDAMPCEVSPLGFHLSLAVKEKIRKGEFIDILSLLPLHKDFMVRTDRRGDEEDRRRPIPQSFNNWLQAFCIYAGVLAEKHPGLCGGLFQHVDHILEAYKNFGGLGWFYYDESFRQKLSIHPMLSWGMKDVELWLNLIPAQKQLASKPPTVNASHTAFRKGCCFAFNGGQSRWNASCKYRHDAGAHPAAKRFKKQGTAGASQAQKDIFSKSLHACEAGKNAPLAGQIPRQGESVFSP